MKYRLNEIFFGKVVSVQSYGAFVKIPKSSQQGMVHRSQVSSAHVDDVTEVLQKGERVWCKVISIEDDDKIKLSMKYVDQGNGTDLDPTGVKLQKDTQRNRNPGATPHKVIQLDAILNTTCTKCGTKGHLSKDCFMTPEGKKYDLIPEIEEKNTPMSIDEGEEKKAESKHKLKKLKKEKKSKKRKRSLDKSDTEEKQRSKKKKKSKEHKQHKKEHSNESSDSSDNTSVSNSHDVKAHKRKHSVNSKTRTKKCKYSKTKHSN